MIRNKRKTSRFVSAVSAVIAAVMLGTTVFASGLLHGFMADDYTVEITNNDEKIEFKNKPFIENGEVYVPLREMLEKAGAMENEGSKIEWDDGKINVYIADDADTDETPFNQFNMEIGRPELVYTVTYTPNEEPKEDITVFIRDFNAENDIAYDVVDANADVSNYGVYTTYSITDSDIAGNGTYTINTIKDIDTDVPNSVEVGIVNISELTTPKPQDRNNAPVLKGSVTYIPYSYTDSIFNGEKYGISYSVYDENGNLVEISGNDVSVRVGIITVNEDGEVVFDGMADNLFIG